MSDGIKYTHTINETGGVPWGCFATVVLILGIVGGCVYNNHLSRQYEMEIQQLKLKILELQSEKVK